MDERENTVLPLIERPRPTIFAAEAIMLLAALGLWVASIVTARLRVPDPTWQEFVYDALYYLPFVGLPVALYCLKRRGLSAALRLNPLPVLPTLTVVLAALLSVYAASAVDGLWGAALDALGLHEPDVSVGIASSRDLSLAILHSAALPAIFEELLCRGLVFSAFESRGTGLAVWVSAALFALMHGNVYGLPAYFMVGAISAFLVFALDSLYAGMVYHTVYNTFILVILYLLPKAGEAVEAQAQAVSPLAVAVDAIFIGILLFLNLRMLDRRRRLMGIEPVPRVREPLRRGERALLVLLGIVFVGTSALVLLGV